MVIGVEKLSRWNIYWKNHKYPCFLADVSTEQLVYVNEEFLKVFNVDQSVIGRSFYEVLQKEEDIEVDITPNWALQKVFESELVFKATKQRFRVTAVLTSNNEDVFCELKPLGESEQENSFEKAMTRCMEIYQQPADTILTSFMELLCSFYGSKKAYVYRINQEDLTINCIAQWTVDPALQVAQDVGEKMDARFLINWIQTQYQTGIVMTNSDDEEFDENSVEAQILTTFKIKNVTMCKVEDINHNVVGVVGLTDRNEADKFFDCRLINTIARFVAQEVAQNAIDTTLFQLNHIDSLTGFYNRLAYSDKIDKMIEQELKSLGVISVNINGLKYINQHAGHLAGDEHIKKSAKQLKEHFDYIFYRMSGDEFIGIAIEVTEEEFESSVMSLHSQMKKEDNYNFSFGHAWGSRSYELDKLITEADTVMYINKQEYYATTNRHFNHVTDTTLSDLLSYLANDEFMVYLQPQVILEDGSLYGAEALVRRFDKANQRMYFQINLFLYMSKNQ